MLRHVVDKGFGYVVKHASVHGDVLVFGGPARLAYHGVGKLREGEHPLTGKSRFNLTFRVS